MAVWAVEIMVAVVSLLGRWREGVSLLEATLEFVAAMVRMQTVMGRRVRGSVSVALELAVVTWFVVPVGSRVIRRRAQN